MAPFAVFASSAEPVPTATYWPGIQWRQSSPEAQGIDSSSLSRAFDYIQQHHLPIHSLLVVRNGFVVLDAYFYPFSPGERHDVASVTKSVTSTLVGIAIGERRISGIDAPFISFFPAEASDQDEALRRKITLEHLLTMTSGMDCSLEHQEGALRAMMASTHWITYALSLPLAYPAGTHFAYCSPGMHLLSGVISKVTHESALAFARDTLFGSLGITDATWKLDGDGIAHGWGDLQLKPDDMARIGYLWLKEGQWKGRQIVPAWYVRAATQVHSSSPLDGSGYGYGLWVSIGGPDARFEATGRGGQRITVVPGKQVIIVTTGGGFDPHDVAGVLFDAISSDNALPENAVALSALKTRVANAARPQASDLTAPAISRDTIDFFSGKRFAVEPNIWDLRSFRFDVATGAKGMLELVFANGHSERLNLDTRGIPVPSMVDGHRVLATLSTSAADTLTVEYNQSAMINVITMDVRRAGTGVEVKLWEKTGGVRATFTGKAL